jgi:hypothetical protein
MVSVIILTISIQSVVMLSVIYAENSVFIVMLNAVLLNIIMLVAIMLSVSYADNGTFLLLYYTECHYAECR